MLSIGAVLSICNYEGNDRFCLGLWDTFPERPPNSKTHIPTGKDGKRLS